MTQNTSLAVVQGLKEHGLAAYYEYPGYVSVMAGEKMRINLNDCGLEGEALLFEIVDANSELLYCAESAISQSSEDVERIVRLTIEVQAEVLKAGAQ